MLRDCSAWEISETRLDGTWGTPFDGKLMGIAVAVLKFSDTEVTSNEAVFAVGVKVMVVVPEGSNDCTEEPSWLAALDDSPTTTTVGLLAVAVFETVTDVAAAWRVVSELDAGSRLWEVWEDDAGNRVAPTVLLKEFCDEELS